MSAAVPRCQCGEPAVLLDRCVNCLGELTATYRRSPDSAPRRSGLAPGLRLGGGKYTLIKRLGGGGMGEVWLADETQLSQEGVRARVALKFVVGGNSTNSDQIRELQREVLTARNLSHPNIIRVYDWSEVVGEPQFYVMEYVEGADLRQILESQPEGRFTFEQIQPILDQLLAGLEFAHSHEGFVHRDLKPANILISQTGRVKLADFGLARPGGEARQLGAVAGATLAYASPQQRRREEIEIRDDLYSLGAVLYHLLTGRLPYPTEVLVKDEPLPEPEHPWRILGWRHRRRVPAEAVLTILSCLSPDPNQRPHDVAMFRQWWHAGPPEPPVQEPDFLKVLRAIWATTLSVLPWLLLGIGVLTSVVLFNEGAKQSARELWKRVFGTNKPVEIPIVVRTKPPVVVGPGIVVVPPNDPPPPPPPTPLSLEIHLAHAGKNINGKASVQLFREDPVSRRLTNSPKWKWTLKVGDPPETQSLPPGRYVVESIDEESTRDEVKDPTRWTRQWIALENSVSNHVAISRQPVLLTLHFTHAADFEIDDPWGNLLKDETRNRLAFPAARFDLHREPVAVGLFDSTRYRYKADLPTVVSTKLLPGEYRLRILESGANAARVDLPPPIPLSLQGESFVAGIRLTNWSHPRLFATWTNSLKQTLLPVPGESPEARPFLGGATEVTYEQFSRFAQARPFPPAPLISITSNGWKNVGGSWRDPFGNPQPKHPVVGITRGQARDFCAWLTETERATNGLTSKQRYALPTAPQWRRMAGAGPYPWGAHFPPTPQDGNYSGKELLITSWPEAWTCLLFTKVDPRSVFVVPVGSYPANALGFRDLGGNAAEWLDDDFRPELNAGHNWWSPPHGLPDSNGAVFGAVCGGSWADGEDRDLLHVGVCWPEALDTGSVRIGFRIVLVEDP